MIPSRVRAAALALLGVIRRNPRVVALLTTALGHALAKLGLEVESDELLLLVDCAVMAAVDALVRVRARRSRPRKKKPLA